VLSVKRTTNAPLPMTSLAPAPYTTGASLTPTLSGLARDRVGGTLTAHFYVRTAGSRTWNIVNGGQVAVTSGSRAGYRLGEGRLRPATAYHWSVRACNAAGVCAPSGPWLRFTTSGS
jgi:hypothetical protein